MPRLKSWSPSNTPPSIDYLDILSGHSVRECKRAAEAFKTEGLDLGAICPANFPLPTVRPLLEKIAASLQWSMGFALLRGIRSVDYSEEDYMIMFFGICSHIASQCGSQVSNRDVITQNTVAEHFQVIPPVRRQSSNAASVLPSNANMGCELLAAQLPWDQIGHMELSSAEAIYQDLTKSHQVVLRTLISPDWPVRIRGSSSVHKMPLLCDHSGHVIISFDPNCLGLDLDKLNEAQRHALIVLNKCANKHQIPIPACTDDIILINNLGFLHRWEPNDNGRLANSGRPPRTFWPAPGTTWAPWAPIGQGSVEIRRAASCVQTNSLTTGPSPDRTLTKRHQLDEHGQKRRWLTLTWIRDNLHGWQIPENVKLPWEEAHGRFVNVSKPERHDSVPQPDQSRQSEFCFAGTEACFTTEHWVILG